MSRRQQTVDSIPVESASPLTRTFSFACCVILLQLFRMSGKGYVTRLDQVVEGLRKGMREGRWRETLPGRARLAAQLGVSDSTVEEAMRRLADEGWLKSQGAGKRRQIVLPKGVVRKRMLRVGFLPFDQADLSAYDMVELRHQLGEAGHSVTIPSKTLTDLGMDVRRVARVVGGNRADAWVIWSASSEVLSWFAEQDRPFLAYAGQYPPGIPMASVAPGLETATVEAVRRLVALGHRRITLLTRAGAKPAYFIRELEAQGISTGRYNLPDCGPGPKDFHRCLESLFGTTPPTAMIIDTLETCLAAQLHLARRGLFPPRDVSLVCTDSTRDSGLWAPSLARIRWDEDAVVRRITQWVNGVARGKEDKRRTYIEAEFIEGGTIGPVPKG